jgi:hypothetical protein
MSLSRLLSCCRLTTAMTLSLYLAGGISASAVSSEERHSLGGPPLCEASAALLVKCPSTDRTCLLVGDNEVRDRLFLFELQDGGSAIRVQSRKEISLKALPPPRGEGAFALSDIESLAGLPSGEVIIYGSHSRNKRCEPKKERRIFAHAFLGVDAMRVGTIGPVRSKKPSCKQLFDGAEGPLTGAVCRAIEHSEASADQAQGNEQTCSDDPPLNVEGAVAVPGVDGEARVWIGLRAPLVDGKAVLLRQVKDRRSFAFDAVALIDLKENGVRELTFAAGKVWGIAGPRAHSGRPHFLWSFDASALKDGALIAPAVAGDLPTSAEGLAISGQNAIVLMDGAQGDNGPTTCRIDSDYIVRRIAD